MTSEHQPGPQVAKSNKDTKRYSKRIILLFIIGVGLLIATITMQAKFGSTGNSSRERERNYRAPQQSGFAELAAEMRRDRRPVQVLTPGEPKHDPEPVRRITIEGTRRELGDLPSLPRYYSNKNDAQAANTLRTLKLQALAAQPVVENFELRRNEVTHTTQRDNGSAPNVMAAGAPSVMDSSIITALMQQGQWQQPDPNRQADKINFMRNSGGSLTSQGYATSLPVPQQFPYELKAGTIIPGKACDRTGSSEGINLCIAEKPVDYSNSSLRLLPHAISGLWNIGAVIPKSGILFDQFRTENCLEEISYNALVRDIFNDSSHPGKVILKNMGNFFVNALEKIEGSGYIIKELVVSGGQCADPLWNQYKADISGRILLIPEIIHAELAGNAILGEAALNSGDIGETSLGMVRIKKRFMPINRL